jgi:metal-responsive CopG/Arc/MetJ family transcriptional regulator
MTVLKKYAYLYDPFNKFVSGTVKMRSSRRMKKRISISLSADVLRRLDHLKGSKHSRSGAIEWILRDYFQREWSRAQARDVELLNKASKQLNVEANDILEYQHW